MSIFNIDVKNIFTHYKQDFDVEEINKIIYGEVRTDYTLIYDILNLLPTSIFKNPNLKWLDPCCANGYFCIVLFYKLYYGLQNEIQDENKRKHHIINNMIFMNEINSIHIPTLKNIFGESANIYNSDYLNMNEIDVDIIISNPPYNYGIVKTPTNNNVSKKNDGASVWQKFIKKMIHQLNDYSHLLTIIPSIWMKYNHPMYNFLTQFKIFKLHTMTNTETNRIFHKQAQTPTCYFHLQKKPTNDSIKLYDSKVNRYVLYPINYNIPVHSSSIIKKLIPYLNKFGSIKALKTNVDPGIRSKKTTISLFENNTYKYKSIKTCLLKENIPIINIQYTNNPCMYYNIKKLVFANKMYGLPFFDIEGKYGISTRDNYIIINKTYNEFIKLQKLFYTKFIIYIFEAARYRMKNLDIAAFEFIPNIIHLFKINEITDEHLFRFFSLENIEREVICNFFKKNIRVPSFI